jgi:equilibrative nucleoside transporter 1/2/3
VSDRYALVLITMYNSGDLIGRCTPLIDRLLLHSRTWLAIWSWARLAFIPCFYFAAKYADQGWMIFLCIMLGWTNGHLSTNIFMVAPNGYTGPEQNAVGNILVLFLILGLSIGVTADWLWLIGKGW